MCITTARKIFIAYTLLVLLIATCAFGDLADRFASESRLDRNLVGVITANIAGTEVKFLLIYINERIFQSGISKNPNLAQKLLQYVGKNALYVNPILEQVVSQFDFSPSQFAVEQEGKPGFIPTSDDWEEITPGFLTGALRENPMETSSGSGSEGVLIMGDDIDPSQPFWVSYQGVRVRFDVAQQTAAYPVPASPTSTTTLSHPTVEISPLERITDLQQALTEGDFSAEAIASLLLLPQDLVGTLVVAGRGEELRLLFVRLEERIYDSALGEDLLSALEPLVGTGAVMVWALSQTGSAFIPWNFYIQQSGTNYVFFSAASFVELTEGFLHSGRVEPGAIVAGVIRLPGGVDTNAQFTIHYGTAGATFGGAEGE